MKSQMLVYDNGGLANTNHLYTNHRQKSYSPVDRMHTRRQYNYTNYLNDLSYSPAAWHKLTTNERTNVIYEKCKLSQYDGVDYRRLQGRDSFRCDDILKIVASPQPSSYSTTINGDTSAAIVSSGTTARGVIMDTITV
ncbi:ORF-135 peptide [Chrysodeixis chalcites nucleopolyhedrovirus]|uniref:ORF-135 peptide n=1 Tax=Chrysodeixis chalcites nucleopolyhedrovirus TaxID=320432 RepID=Q4KSU6_9ABAC|nr:ORF-135 peptide [Chrysodeixis chalcites nucleopolyhedrovirus]AGC36349.1 hypothetical protein TF1A_00135 [Chrysodeixis chalcites SNPV TF1-A]AAY84066.1 ORF-135 peptide [Chrysodeixis chalcites nucleopolyhedrovirus]AGE61394.1 hypothetical protein [Chrysodeixis chalcites nucleopolyhedrovirus]AGE61541.1 hypothetical protein [Chrysodeixis chalcites nucleopolyhedrovirus]AGE61695.1 hypothetical protein [Chrysodeixis chalcites nucleopolyhedrovirus]